MTPRSSASGASTTAKTTTRSRAKATESEATEGTTPRTRKAPAAKPAARGRSKAKAAEPTVADMLQSGVTEVSFKREGNDVVLTVGGKKSSLDEVDVLITTPGTPEEEISKRREGGGKVIVA